MGGGRGPLLIRSEIRFISNNDLEELIKKTIEDRRKINRPELMVLLGNITYFMNEKHFKFTHDEIEYLIAEKIEKFTRVEIAQLNGITFYTRIPEVNKEKFEEEKVYH